jgi:hypothetical protein
VHVNHPCVPYKFGILTYTVDTPFCRAAQVLAANSEIIIMLHPLYFQPCWGGGGIRVQNRRPLSLHHVSSIASGAVLCPIRLNTSIIHADVTYVFCSHHELGMPPLSSSHYRSSRLKLSYQCRPCLESQKELICALGNYQNQ